MDIMYHAVKNLLKSLINLIAAILELFTNVINWLASCLRNFYPHISGKYAQIHENRKRGVGLLEQKKSKKKDSGKREEIEEIYSQLKTEVTGKEQYYTVYLKASEDGSGFYAILVSGLGLVLAGCAAAAGVTGDSRVCIAALTVMILSCAAVCLMIHRHQKKAARNRLAAHILEMEFADMFREDIKAMVGKAEAIQQEAGAVHDEQETMQKTVGVVQDKRETVQIAVKAGQGEQETVQKE